MVLYKRVKLMGVVDSSNNSDEVYKRRVEPVLISLSNSYSELNSISVCTSKPSSYST